MDTFFLTTSEFRLETIRTTVLEFLKNKILLFNASYDNKDIMLAWLKLSHQHNKNYCATVTSRN